MPQLLPLMIQKQFAAGNAAGGFSAVTLFTDLSGFTKMTETLMRGGDEGAEIMSDILNAIFNPLVDSIYAHGGFISSFGGDAFTAIFPDDLQIQPAAILHCALKNQELLSQLGRQKTRFGDFEISGKMGLSHGIVEWGIIGQELKAFFFRGPAIDACAAAEHQAGKGDVIFDQHLQQLLPPQAVLGAPLDDGFYFLNGFEQEPAAPILAEDGQTELARETLLKFMPEAVVDFKQLGEFRNAVSVFISFDGVAAQSQLDLFVSLVIRETIHFGGYFNRVDFGDKGGVVLCIFGAPIAHEDNIERTLDFILAVRQGVAAARQEHHLLDNLRFRAGITYGPVYAGLIGGNRRCEYTVIGDQVNLAARFMMKADFGELWVSENVYRSAQPVFNLELAGQYEYKGKSEKIASYRLKSKKIAAAAVYAGKFVGRSKELGEIDQIFQPLADGKSGGIVYIYGEPGAGKSRLMYEVKKRHQNLHWLYLVCDGIQRKPFNTFTRFFSGFFNQSAEFALAQNQANFEEVYDQLLAGATGDIHKELVRLQSVLGGFLGIVYPGSLYEQLDAKLRYENTLYAFKEMFKALALVNPVGIEIEDIQWIDADSGHAFETICRNLGDFPILFICTSRYHEDQSRPHLPVDMPALEIDLNQLMPEGVVELAEALLDGPLALNFKQHLIERTAGNPFFIEQTALYYRESGIAARHAESGLWEMVKDESSIPATVTDMLVSRIDRLTDKLKEALQVASVLGQEFEFRVLSEMLRSVGQTWQPDELEAEMKTGENSKVLSVFSEIRGIFAHALLHNAVYNMQLKSRLRLLHNLAAETIARLHPDNKSVYADLAYHYERAEVRDLALAYLEKAGDYAKDNWQNEAALGFYQRWLDDSRKDLDDLLADANQVDAAKKKLEAIVDTIVYKKNHLLVTLGRVDEAAQDADLALKIGQVLGDDDRVGGAIHDIANQMVIQGNYKNALPKFEEGLKFLEKAQNKRMIAISLNNIGKVFWYSGKTQEALAFFEKELTICKEFNYDRGIARAYGSLGVVFDYSGDAEKAMQFYQKQLEINEQIQNKAGIADALNNIGNVYCYHFRKYDAAVDYYQRMLNLSQELGSKKEVARAFGNIGDALHEQGQYEDALDFHKKKFSLCRELEDKEQIALVLINMGRTYTALNQFIEASTAFKNSIDLINKLNLNYLLPACLIENGDLNWQMGNRTLAHDLIIEGLKIARDSNNAEYIHKGETLMQRIASS